MNKSDFASLALGQVIYHQSRKNADGSRWRARVNGKLQEWKRSGGWRIPMMHGLREGFYIGAEGFCGWTSREFSNPANWVLEDN